jgi:hypothetical protein
MRPTDPLLGVTLGPDLTTDLPALVAMPSVEDCANPGSEVVKVQRPPVSGRDLDWSELTIRDVLTSHERFQPLSTDVGRNPRRLPPDTEEGFLYTTHGRPHLELRRLARRIQP